MCRYIRTLRLRSEIDQIMSIREKDKRQSKIFETLFRSELTVFMRKCEQPIRNYAEDTVLIYKRFIKSQIQGRNRKKIICNQVKGNSSNIAKKSKLCVETTQKNDRMSGKIFFETHKHPQNSDNILTNGESEVGKTFTIASNFLKDSLNDNILPLEDRIIKWIQKWCTEWKTDLDCRPKHAARSARGKRAYIEFDITIKAFDNFFEQLKKRTLKKELRDGLWPIILAMKKRDYLHANTILLNTIAIGNSPWPIGVTQVGIHTKSAAREKISTIHSNKNAAAHIMSDEATRKCLHGLKRLLTVVQRLYPTDPSQCAEFFDEIDHAKGSFGAGSLKLALVKVKDPN